MANNKKASLSDLADHMDKEASKFQSKFTTITNFAQAQYCSQSLIVFQYFLQTFAAALNAALALSLGLEVR